MLADTQDLENPGVPKGATPKVVRKKKTQKKANRPKMVQVLRADEVPGIPGSHQLRMGAPRATELVTPAAYSAPPRPDMPPGLDPASIAETTRQLLAQPMPPLPSRLGGPSLVRTTIDPPVLSDAAREVRGLEMRAILSTTLPPRPVPSQGMQAKQDDLVDAFTRAGTNPDLEKMARVIEPSFRATTVMEPPVRELPLPFYQEIEVPAQVPKPLVIPPALDPPSFGASTFDHSPTVCADILATQTASDDFISMMCREGERRGKEFNNELKRLQDNTRVALAAHEAKKPGVSGGPWTFMNPGKLVKKGPAHVVRAKRDFCTLPVVMGPQNLSVVDMDKMLDELTSCWSEILGQREMVKRRRAATLHQERVHKEEHDALVDKLNAETAKVNIEQANWLGAQLQEAGGLLYRMSNALDQMQEQLKVAKAAPVAPVIEPMEIAPLEPSVTNPLGFGLTFGMDNLDYSLRTPRSTESPARPGTSASTAGTSQASGTPPRVATEESAPQMLRVSVAGVKPQLATPNARMAERIAEISSRMPLYGEDDEASDDYEPG